MAPGFQKLVNKWVKISRNAEALHTNWGSNHCRKVKSEDHSTQTAETSTACSSYYGGHLVDNGEKPVPQEQVTCKHCLNIKDKVDEYMKITRYFNELECKHCQSTLSDAIKAVESMNMKTCDSGDEAMSEGENDSWMAETSSQDSGEVDSECEEQSKVGAFLHQLAGFVEKEANIPFDLIDLWVPVFSSDKARLCYAGHIVASNASNSIAKHEFGQSSMMFSFESGSGIPGRVYASGLPIWESDLSNSASFERREDARKYGINTCLGFPVDSTVGRIVAIFYTEHQIIRRDESLVQFIHNSITSNWNPDPRWMLELDSDIVDETSKMQVSDANPPIARFSNNSNSPPSLQPISRQSSASSSNADNRSLDFEIANLLAEQMPMGESPLSSGFVSLRLFLLRSARSTQEEEIVGIVRRSYRGYVVIQRTPQDIALLLVQDYTYLQTSLTRNNARQNNGIRMRSVSNSDMSTSLASDP